LKIDRLLQLKFLEANISGINVYSLHPGIIPTNIIRRSNKALFPGFTFCCNIFFQLFYKNAKQGAQTTIYCSVEEVTNENGFLLFVRIHYILNNMSKGSISIKIK